MASSPQVMLAKAWVRGRRRGAGKGLTCEVAIRVEVVDERKGVKSRWQALILDICTRSNQVENPFLALVPPATQPCNVTCAMQQGLSV